MFTVKTKKSKDLAIKCTKILENQKYDNLIAGQEAFDYNNQLISEAAGSLKNTSSYRRRKMIQKRSKLQETIQNKLFTEAVYTVFYNSLMLDESVKERHDEKLYSLTEATINSYLESHNLKLKDLKRRNGLLEDLISLCEEIAQDEVKERYSEKDILNELEDEDEEVGIDSDSKEMFDKEVDSATSEIVDDVKSRVLETIEREQQIATEKKEMDEEIQAYKQSSETPEVTTAGSMTGGVENIDDSSDTEETAPEEEIMDGKAPATVPKQLGESASITFEKIQLKAPTRIKKVRTLQEQTLFGSILKSISIKAAKEATLNESSLNMDLVFSESVMMLTLFESLQILGVTDYSPLELRQFGRQLVQDSRSK